GRYEIVRLLGAGGMGAVYVVRALGAAHAEGIAHRAEVLHALEAASAEGGGARAPSAPLAIAAAASPGRW
ncbi:MAG: hypothetical protein ACXVDD_03525, partial [Polyangia bacterium]